MSFSEEQKNVRNALIMAATGLIGFGTVARYIDDTNRKIIADSIGTRETNIVGEPADNSNIPLEERIIDPLLAKDKKDGEIVNDKIGNLRDIGNIYQDNEIEYLEFRYQDEIPQILKHSRRVGVEPEMIMALRMTENGKDHIAYGIMPQGNNLDRYNSDTGYSINGTRLKYEDEKEKQLCWAAWTIKRNKERFDKDNEGHKDFISYLASKYAPIGAENDSEGLNINWERNFRHWYETLHR